MSQKPFIDAHQHVWKCSEREYSWITPDITHLLGHDYIQEQVNPSIAKFGITGTVYVQAADTYDDTFYMFHSASKNPQIAAPSLYLVHFLLEPGASLTRRLNTHQKRTFKIGK